MRLSASGRQHQRPACLYAGAYRRGLGGGSYFQIDRITRYHRLAVCCLWDFFSITFILALLIFKLIKNVYQTGDIEDIEENVLYVPVDDAHAMAYAEWDN